MRQTSRSTTNCRIAKRAAKGASLSTKSLSAQFAELAKYKIKTTPKSPPAAHARMGVISSTIKPTLWPIQVWRTVQDVILGADLSPSLLCATFVAPDNINREAAKAILRACRAKRAGTWWTTEATRWSTTPPRTASGAWWARDFKTVAQAVPYAALGSFSHEAYPMDPFAAIAPPDATWKTTHNITTNTTVCPIAKRVPFHTSSPAPQKSVTFVWVAGTKTKRSRTM